MECFYLNSLTIETISFMDECIDKCKDIFKIYKTNLIFKLKDFHIYINYGNSETDNQQILDNIENIFSVLYKYVSSIEVIVLNLD